MDVVFQDNTTPAGTMRGSVLDLELEIVNASWRPLGPDKPAFPIFAFTIESVGEMYEVRGDTAQAVEAYRDFVEWWKNAVPELQPRVVEARKRLEALTPVERVRETVTG